MNRTTEWRVVDDWWNRASIVDSGTLSKLQALFSELDEQWAASSMCFDQDPLCAAWSDDGPLRTSQEENWSQWLAHLCSTAPPAFIKAVFGLHVVEQPGRVQCEVPLSSDATHDRRADILVRYPDTGISIEVKIDDDQYGKTPETAGLIEQHDRARDWSHYLLLPASNHEALRATIPALNEDVDDHAVLSDSDTGHPNVTVLYWRDVSYALRRALLTSNAATPHWQAAAYSLITIIETQLCDFLTEPLVTDDVTTGFAAQLRLKNAPLNEQLAYLTDTINDA